ncbi:MAG: hypothetical protein AB7U73_11095 [Pirellulales bacterium]
MTELALAVMIRELLGREDELAIGGGLHLARVVGVVVGVDREAASHRDRRLVKLIVEHHPRAEAAHAGQPRLIHDGVGPHHGNAIGLGGTGLAGPAETADVELRATAAGQRNCQYKASPPSYSKLAVVRAHESP